jgi:hypothetical protein
MDIGDPCRLGSERHAIAIQPSTADWADAAPAKPYEADMPVRPSFVLAQESVFCATLSKSVATHEQSALDFFDSCFLFFDPCTSAQDASTHYKILKQPISSVPMLLYKLLSYV